MKGNRLIPHVRACLSFSRPPGVVEWLEKTPIVLPASMSPRQPGPFRVAARPQMGPILECFHPNSGVRNLTVAGASQLFKTTVGTLATAYLIKHAPGPMLVVGPSEDWTAKEIGQKRLRALIDENHTLRIEKPFDKDLYKALHLGMTSMPIDLVGANSPTGLAGSTRRYVWIEEAAKIRQLKHEAAPESHPINLAKERTKDFAGMELCYESSTPNSPHHLFWQGFLKGDQTIFPVKCRHCGEYFPFEWIYKQNRDKIAREFYAKTPEDYTSVIWPAAARQPDGSWDQEMVKRDAKFICPHNGCEITNEDKMAMLPHFEQHRQNPHAPDDTRSFRIPSFYSPRVTFGDMVIKFLARGDLFTSGLQNFFNSWCAWIWEELEYNIKEAAILKLRGTHARGVLPSKPDLLLFTSDPGEHATHWMVTAIMKSGQAIVIDWGTVNRPEDLLDPAFKAKLSYPISGTDKRMSPHLGYVDSKFRPETIYAICKASNGWLWPTRGQDAKSSTWNESAPASHPDLKVYRYSDQLAKDELYGARIALGQDPGIVLPVDADADLILGLAGQQKDAQTGHWKELLNDHYGDTLKLAIIGFWIAREYL
jgi:hypothetical protein